MNYMYEVLFSCLLQVGSADHHIYYYDLRNINQPLHILSGHRKAVSYVKFLSNSELASASTDSTLRLWDVKENVPVSFILLTVHFSAIQTKGGITFSASSSSQPKCFIVEIKLIF